MRSYQNYIDGKWMSSQNKQYIETRDPANGTLLAQVPRGTREDVNLAVESARRAFEGKEWRLMLPVERGRLLYRLSERILQQKEELARMESLDSGKPLSQALSDVVVSARYCEYYAGIADKILGETIPVSPDILDYTLREPLGVSAQIVPWNYPLQIMMRGVAPALATGNTVIVKPAEDTPITALMLAKLTEEVGFPAGVINVVTGYGSEAGAALVSHPDINQITFTGSVTTGISVMKAAAENVVPVTLELGGKSPNIVFSDADLEEASTWVVKSITQNAGQTCSAGSRLLVQRSIEDVFLQKVVAKIERLIAGHGLDNPDLGPIISEKQLQIILDYMEIAKQEGLDIVTGGHRITEGDLSKGSFMKPTIIRGVQSHHRLAQEEVFGPILSVLTFETVEEAIQLANGTEFGLVTAIWTKNIDIAHQVASRIKAGQIYINTYGAGGGVELPFGGVRKSGFGREKGLETLRQYTQLKNVAIKLSNVF
jgi:aldehyde dehydrogenase (NAD+)